MIKKSGTLEVMVVGRKGTMSSQKSDSKSLVAPMNRSRQYSGSSRRSMFRNRSNATISRSSFQNLRLRSLTVDSTADIFDHLQVGMGLEIYDETPDMSLNLLNAWQDMITLDEDEENDMYIIDSDSEHYQTPEEDDADYDEWMDLEDEEQLGSPPVPKNNGHPQPTYQRALSPIISVTSPGGKSKSNSVTPDGKFPNAISHGIVSDEIFQQLQCFGYDSRSDIQQAMEDAVNPENINEIIDRLKENENHNTNVQSIIEHIKQEDEFTMLQTPNRSPSIDVEVVLTSIDKKQNRSRAITPVITPITTPNHNPNSNPNGSPNVNRVTRQSRQSRKSRISEPKAIPHEISVSKSMDEAGDIFEKEQPFNNQSLAEMKEDHLRHSSNIQIDPSELTDYEEQSVSKEVNTESTTYTTSLQQVRNERQAQKRTYYEEEIRMTEQAYHRGLGTLHKEFLRPIYVQKMVDKQYEKEILSLLDMVQNIAKFHDSLLTQIDAYRSNGKSVAMALNSFMKSNKDQFISLYLEWIKHYDDTLDLFGKKLHENHPKLKAFLKEKRRERKPLSGFLILPVQRVPRYILLLNNLRKCTDTTAPDYKVIGEAIELIESIAKDINDRKAKIENYTQCLQIQEALTNLEQSIVGDGDRSFLEEFIFIKKGIKHQRIFFVFSDIVIIANEKWRVKQVMNINTMEIKVIDKDIKEQQDDEEDEPEPIFYADYGNAARRSLVMTSNLKRSMVDLTNEATKSMKQTNKRVKEENFPEFELFSAAEHDSTRYIAKDLESIVQFRETVRKQRHNIMRKEIKGTNLKNRYRSTLGSFGTQLDQQELIKEASK